jgi:LSD1 subclass zinc finger protein
MLCGGCRTLLNYSLLYSLVQCPKCRAVIKPPAHLGLAPPSAPTTHGGAPSTAMSKPQAHASSGYPAAAASGPTPSVVRTGANTLPPGMTDITPAPTAHKKTPHNITASTQLCYHPASFIFASTNEKWL